MTWRLEHAELGFRRTVANRHSLGAVPVVTLLQLAAICWTPHAAILDLRPLALTDCFVVLGLAALPAVAGQALHYGRATTATVGKGPLASDSTGPNEKAPHDPVRSCGASLYE